MSRSTLRLTAEDRASVQTHVSHILAKLGARSRVEVAAEALEHVRPPERAAG